MGEAAPTMRIDGAGLKSEAGTSKTLSLCGQNTPRTERVALGRIDQYELLRELGGGGFGVVYLARDTVAGINVAVKGLPPLVKNTAEELERIRENFALVSKLHHPHIAAALVLHPAKEVSYSRASVRQALRVLKGDYLMVMAFAPGVTLSKWRKQFPEGRAPVHLALDVCSQIAEALDYAHSEKIAHRDIKPSNVMVETKEKNQGAKGHDFDEGGLAVRVLDFGLAAEIRSSLSRVSQEKGDTSGTRPYMAPEQWAGLRQDGRTDQYALAIIFYELVSGAVPFASAFETGDPVIMMTAVENKRPAPLPALTRAQNAALSRALAKKPGQRFQTCKDFAVALGARAEVAPKRREKGWLAWAATVMVALAGLSYLIHASRKCAAPPAVQPAEVATPANNLAGRPDAPAKPVPVSPPAAVQETAPDLAAEAAVNAARMDAEKLWEQVRALDGAALADLADRKLGVEHQWRLGAQAVTDKDKTAAMAAFASAKESGEALLADFRVAEKHASEAQKYQSSRSIYAKALAKEDAAFLKAYGGAAWEEVQRLAGEGETSAFDPAKGARAYDAALASLAEAVKGAKAAKVKEEQAALSKRAAPSPAPAVVVAKPQPAVALAQTPAPKTAQPPRTEEPARMKAESQPAGPKIGQPFTLERVGGCAIAFVYIRPGDFVMGADESDEDERPAHPVTISKGFWLARTEVTRGVYNSVMNGSAAPAAGADLPAERVSWTDAVQFCRLLRQQTDGRLAEGFSFRLPTEAEWEYACRAGTTGRFFFDGGLPSLGKYAWYRQNSRGRTQPVGGREPNPWGLCDMLGGVSEWCSDWYDVYPGLQAKNRFMGQICRVLRGGDYTSAPSLIACSGRTGAEPEERSDGIGFRVVLEGK